MLLFGYIGIIIIIMSKLLLTSIGNKLRLSRIKLNLTQVEVAKLAKISTNHYAQIERGEASPSIVTLQSILNVLKVSSSKILPF